MIEDMAGIKEMLVIDNEMRSVTFKLYILISIRADINSKEMIEMCPEINRMLAGERATNRTLMNMKEIFRENKSTKAEIKSILKLWFQIPN